MRGPALYQIDAFTAEAFSGNPAVVCLLPRHAERDWMQAVAGEMSAPATAFVVMSEGGYPLRWFTPMAELERCGHGTLAATRALMEEGAVRPDDVVRFDTRWGGLGARIVDDWIELDLPAEHPRKTYAEPSLAEALGVRIERAIVRDRGDLLVELEDEDAVRAVHPDYERLSALIPRGGVIVTAAANPGAGYDFVSRVFAPGDGLPEDPVTGSAHCLLGPFWAERTGRFRLTAFQASRRGGTLRIAIEGDRVLIAGQATTVFRGALTLPTPADEAAETSTTHSILP